MAWAQLFCIFLNNSLEAIAFFSNFEAVGIIEDMMGLES